MRVACAWLAIGVLVASGAPCRAEVATPDEIIVTAQKRAEPIITTPIAIAAFDQRFIASTKLATVKDVVKYTPGFSGDSQSSYIDDLAIRGIVSNDYGIGGDPSIGIFKDGVYQGRSGGAVTALYDVERAEALRGPQGFLFGRNAISGAISIVTAKPDLDAIGGHVYLGLGETRRHEAEAAINVPLGNRWAIRIAGYHLDAGGWIDNAFTAGVNDRLMAQNASAVRGSLLYAEGPLRIVLTGEHERRRADGTAYRASSADHAVLDYLNAALDQNIVIAGGPGAVDSDLDRPRDDGSVSSVNMQIDLDAGFATFTSISAWRSHRFDYVEDYDGTPLRIGNYRQRQRGHYASQEMRLVSPGGGTLNWSAGVSLFREKIRSLYTNEADERIVCLAGYGYPSCEALTQDLFGTDFSPAPGGVLIETNEARATNTGLSTYGDANYAITPNIWLGAGLRFSHDHKQFALDIPPSNSALGNIWTFTYRTDGFIDAAQSWNGWTPRLYARWQPSRHLSVYASLTRGYKAGGFGTFTVDAPAAIALNAVVPAGTRPDSFAPETLWSEEIGVKGSLFGNRLQFDLTGFHYVYRNLQTNYFDPATRTQQVINIGRVQGHGIESAVTFRPGRYFDVRANLTYTRTAKSGDRDCMQSDCGGLPNPGWASSGVATLHYPIAADEAYLAGEWTYQGRRRESFDWRGITRRDAYADIALRLGYRAGKRWEADVYVQNLFDAHYYGGAENGGGLIPANVWGASQPRNAGVNLRFSFGG